METAAACQGLPRFVFYFLLLLFVPQEKRIEDSKTGFSRAKEFIVTLNESLLMQKVCHLLFGTRYPTLSLVLNSLSSSANSRNPTFEIPIPQESLTGKFDAIYCKPRPSFLLGSVE